MDSNAHELVCAYRKEQLELNEEKTSEMAFVDVFECVFDCTFISRLSFSYPGQSCSERACPF